MPGMGVRLRPERVIDSAGIRTDGVANLPPSAHSRLGTLMKDPDLVPLAAWIMWEAFFDEPEPTDAHRKDDQRREPPEVKPPPRTR